LKSETGKVETAIANAAGIPAATIQGSIENLGHKRIVSNIGGKFPKILPLHKQLPLPRQGD
jgi:hypothetical protein